MREKRPALVVTFDTTAAAMAAERFCLDHGLPGRMIPVPREIAAGCGLAWKAPQSAEEQVKTALKEAGISWSAMQIVTI